MAYPIFVIGRNRSGTKWLSNLLANSPEVACVQREGAGGIIETGLFGSVPRVFGPLTIPENYLGFLAWFSQSNAFRVMGLPRHVLYCAECTTYTEYFRYIMDRYAEKEGKRFWLQKASVEPFRFLLSAYPDARFVTMKRAIEPNIRSAVGLAESLGQPRRSVVRLAAGYCRDEKRLAKALSWPNVLSVTYEELRADTAGTARRVCEFVGVASLLSKIILNSRQVTIAPEWGRMVFAYEIKHPIQETLVWYRSPVCLHRFFR